MGYYKKALFSVSVPGCSESSKRKFKEMREWIYKKFPEAREVDSVLGSFMLNQDWIEFESPAETDWSWVRPNGLTEEEWEFFYYKFHDGEWVGVVYYKDSEGELHAHH